MIYSTQQAQQDLFDQLAFIPLFSNQTNPQQFLLSNQLTSMSESSHYYLECEEHLDFSCGGNSTSQSKSIQIACNCKNSGCKKMYCECLARGLQCNEKCIQSLNIQTIKGNCFQCDNFHINEKHIQVKKLIEKSNNNGKVRTKFRSQRFRHGCTCQKSQCQKRYCECYIQGKKCGNGCKCINCKNLNDIQNFKIQKLKIEQTHFEIPEKMEKMFVMGQSELEQNQNSGNQLAQ